jgi:hypothetical protein
MRQSRKIRPLRRALVDLATLFAAPVLEIGDCLVITNDAGVNRHIAPYAGDPVGFEALVTHVHLEDILVTSVEKLKRRDLLLVGKLIMQVWSDRLVPYLRGRRVRFYLGGPRGVFLRFHVIREGVPNWTNLAHKEILQREKVLVFTLSEDGFFEDL